MVVTLAARDRAHFPGDVHPALLLQALEWPGEDKLVRIENLLGNGPVPVAVMLAATVAFLLSRRFVACLAFLFSFSTATWPLPALPIDLAQRPRPSPTLIAVNEPATGYSFPGGDVLTALMLYGALAALVSCLPLSRLARLLEQ